VRLLGTIMLIKWKLMQAEANYEAMMEYLKELGAKPDALVFEE